MPIHLKLKFGQNEVTITGADEKEIFQGASFWGQLPTECGSCKSKEIGLIHSTPSGYEYYMMKCRGCGYEFKFGIRKEDHKLFPKPEKNNTGGWVPPYQGREEEEYESPPPRQQTRQPASRPSGPPQKARIPVVNLPEDEEDEIPF